MPVVVPMLAAAFLAATNWVGRRALADVTALAAAVATVVFCALLLEASFDGPIVAWLGGWQPRDGVAIGVGLVIDEIGAGAALLVGVIATAALFYSVRYFDAVGNIYHALMLVFIAGMTGFCLTGDLFTMFVFFELMSIPAYALTAYKIEERGPIQGALNFAVVNSIGAFAILVGITLIYTRTGALNLAQIGASLAGRDVDMVVVCGFLMITVGFLAKAAAVPLHFWLADAHAVAPTPVCVLFSGVMVPLGLYGLARVYWTGFAGALGPHAADLRAVLVGVGVLTAVIGAVMCFAQRHVKRLLALSTVSHVGLVLVAIAMFSPEGTAGGAAYVASHGLAKAALFMAAGALLHRFTTIDEHELQGRGRDGGWSLRLTVVVWVAGAFVLAGLPLTGTFFGKSLADGAALHEGFAWLPALLAATTALTAGAVLRVTGRVFGGWGHRDERESQEAEAEEEESETLDPHDRTPWVMVAPALGLVAAALAIGLVPGFIHGTEHAAARFQDRTAYAATVLRDESPRFESGQPSDPKPHDYAYGAASTVAAFALAALALWGRRIRRSVPGLLDRAVTVPLGGLRALHSGHPGDYVAWLTVVLAVLGGLFTVALR